MTVLSSELEKGVLESTFHYAILTSACFNWIRPRSMYESYCNIPYWLALLVTVKGNMLSRYQPVLPVMLYGTNDIGYMLNVPIGAVVSPSVHRERRLSS